MFGRLRRPVALAVTVFRSALEEHDLSPFGGWGLAHEQPAIPPSALPSLPREALDKIDHLLTQRIGRIAELPERVSVHQAA